MEFDSKCEICQGHQVALACVQCNLDLCIPCANDRHRIGALTRHKFQLLPLSRMDPGNIQAPQEDLCQWCEQARYELKCLLCDVFFCQACADEFHSPGTGPKRASLLQHKTRFEYRAMSPSSSPTMTPARRLPAALPTGLPSLSPSAFGAGSTAADALDSFLFSSSSSSSSATAPTVRAASASLSSLPHDSEHHYQQHQQHNHRRVVSSVPFSSPTPSSSLLLSRPLPVTIPESSPIKSELRQLSGGGGISGAGAGGGSQPVSAASSPSHAPSPTAPHPPPPHHGYGHWASEPVPSRRPSGERRDSKTQNPPSAVEPPASGNMTPPKAISTLTFKLFHYALENGVGSFRSAKELANNPKQAPRVTFHITVDSGAHMLTVSEIDKTKERYVHHTRHFVDLEAVIADPNDPRFFFLLYKNSKAVAQCFATSEAEGRTLREALETSLKETKCDAEKIRDDEPILVTRVIKKGKMSWAPRTIVLKRRKCELYKVKPTSTPPFVTGPPDHVMSLPAHVTTSGLSKQITITGADRPFTFKPFSIAERDMFTLLLKKAGEMPDFVPPSRLGSITIPAASLVASLSPSLPASPTHAPSSVPPSPLPTIASASSSPTPSTSAQTPNAINTSTDGYIRGTIPFPSPAPVSTPPVGGGGTIPPLGDISASSSPLTMIDPSLSQLPPIAEGGSPSRHGSFSGTPGVFVGERKDTAAKRRMSRRAFSRDFDSIINNPRSRQVSDFVCAEGTALGPVSGKIEFTEIKVDDLAPYVRPNLSLRIGVYQLMEALLTSMVTGASVTASLFVPKTAWQQSGLKFQGFNAKLEHFETLRVALLTVMVSDLDGDMEQFQRNLVAFRKVTEEVQNKLALSLNFIHSCKDQDRVDGPKSKSAIGSIRKSMQNVVKYATRAATKAIKIDDSSKYIGLLRSVLDTASVFRLWAEAIDERKLHYETVWGQSTLQVVMDHLERIGEFFYSVVCNVVIRDLKVVLKRYMKHGTKSLQAV